MQRIIGIVAAVVIGLLLIGGCTAKLWPGWANTKTTPTPTPKALTADDVRKIVADQVQSYNPASTTTAFTTTTTTQAAPTPAPTSTPKPVAACQPIPDYDKPPQPQIGHPSFYIETGIESTRCWVVTVKPGFIAVIGGFTVDGVSNGVYKAVAAGTLTTTVTNGFLAIPVAEVARDEYCFRLGQAVQYKWAHSNEFPLVNWTACSFTGSTSTATVVTTTVTTAGTNARTATGKGDKTLPFPVGASVAGFLVALSDGRTCNGCYVDKAPLAGTVTDGVIWPWPEEVVGLAKPTWK